MILFVINVCHWLWFKVLFWCSFLSNNVEITVSKLHIVFQFPFHFRLLDLSQNSVIISSRWIWSRSNKHKTYFLCLFQVNKVEFGLEKQTTIVFFLKFLLYKFKILYHKSLHRVSIIASSSLIYGCREAPNEWCMWLGSTST